MKPLSTTIVLLALAAALPCVANGANNSQNGDLADNAALIYWRAFSELPNLSPEQWKQQSKALTDPCAAPLDQIVIQIAHSSSWARASLGRASKLRRCAWAIESEAGFDPPLPHLFKAARLADYAVLTARLSLSRNDTGPKYNENSATQLMDFRGHAAWGVSELIATLHLARHVSVDPYYACLSVGLIMEGRALRAAAAGLKDMDAAAMNDLLVGLDGLPAGGTMAAVMAESRRRLAELASDLESQKKGQNTLAPVMKHFGGNCPGDGAEITRTNWCQA